MAGGWGPALGWSRPAWCDLWWGLLWTFVQLTVSVVLRAVYDSVASASTVHASLNTRNVTYHGPVWLVLVLLGAAIGAFGFFQCLLVRITGRLAPGAITHGLTNTLALVAALTR